MKNMRVINHKPFNGKLRNLGMNTNKQIKINTFTVIQPLFRMTP